MSKFEFEFPDHYGKEFEEINEYGTEKFTKYRLKSDNVTVDIAVVEIRDSSEKYIEERKKDFEDMDVRVPSPYTSEIIEKDKDKDYPLEFKQRDNIKFGISYAGPEYKLMLKNAGQIPRYRYIITWKEIDQENKLAEIEVYINKDDFRLEEALDFTRDIKVQKNG